VEFARVPPTLGAGVVPTEAISEKHTQNHKHINNKPCLSRDLQLFTHFRRAAQSYTYEAKLKYTKHWAVSTQIWVKYGQTQMLG